MISSTDGSHPMWSFLSTTANIGSKLVQMFMARCSCLQTMQRWTIYWRKKKGWRLEENGKCLNNIRPSKSTIGQTRRGAFATCLIPRGLVVAPAPLIHIPRWAVLNIYDGIEYKDGTVERNMTSVKQRQMRLKYCFGHANLTLLLSTYGHFLNLINHNGANLNAKIAWVNKKSMGHNPDWLNLPVNELGDRQYLCLAFYFIATRDILPGEEAFIDSGPKREDEWNNHVTNWVSSEGLESYSPAFVWNQDTEMHLNSIPNYSSSLDVFFIYPSAVLERLKYQSCIPSRNYDTRWDLSQSLDEQTVKWHFTKNFLKFSSWCVMVEWEIIWESHRINHVLEWKSCRLSCPFEQEIA